MASPPGPGSAHRRTPLSSFPSRAAGPFLRHQHLPGGGDSDAGAASAEEVEGDEDSMDDEYDDQEVDHAASIWQQGRTSSSSQGIGQAVLNGENGVWQIEDQEGQQCRLHNGGTGQHGQPSPRGDEEPGLSEMRVEDGYGVIGRREGGPASSYWDLLRAHLSDPLTVQAFRREEESAKTLKRRRDRLEQDKNGNDDPNPTELSRGKGVQYPFAVLDRVMIKGNKRTPERFVGRVAVLMAQCLNGWYMVKTLDNAESVKLQYRSLAKFTDSGGGEPSAMASNSAQDASWL